MTTRRVNLNTESVDNYLKAIFTLGGSEEEQVQSTALAEHLGVAPASITNMLQKLAAAPMPMVEYESRRGVRLSAAGRRRALEILRHHRLLETFLYEMLDYPIEEVHDEAERLEHFISERFEERIDAKLGRPKFDPHGHCIPALDGKMSKRASWPLSAIEDDGAYIVDSVSDRDAVLLKKLKSHGITPGTHVQVANSSQDTLLLKAAGAHKPLSLPRSASSAVCIRTFN
jgi:DtxR family transcriptional regulator, Mn-dependent transcriptional regulator